MKRILLAILACLPLAAAAQGNWERPDNPRSEATVREKTGAKEAEPYQYEKYLGPVVPEVDGEVVWQRTFADNKSADENYAAMLGFLTAMTEAEGQLKESNVSLVNRQEHKIACHFEEWMVFANTLLSLDRTRFIYTLMADCADGSVTVRLFRINYWYDELRDGGERYKAEEWITDRWGLNKKHTRLAKASGKFRRKTVDRVEEIFNNIANSLNAQ